MAATSSIPAVVATPREGKFNKNAARRVRAAGKIPAVVYGAGQASVAVTVDPRIITKILHSDSGHNTIFDLDVAGAQVKAMVVDWQHDPVKGALLHIDLKRIAMDKAIQVSVPIQLIGVPLGVKTQGGILEHVLREVEVECLPSDIPGHLDVDVSALEINGSVHVSDLPHTAKIKFLSDEGLTVAHVAAIKEEVVEPEAVDATAVLTEPEVVKKGKGEADAAPDAKVDAKAAKADAKADDKAEKSDRKK